MQMTTEKKSKSDNKKSIELMTALYKKHYDELWSKLPPTSQQLIIEDPLGRRAKALLMRLQRKQSPRRMTWRRSKLK